MMVRCRFAFLILSITASEWLAQSHDDEPQHIRGTANREQLDIKPRIVGGQAVVPDRYPYFTFIRLKTDQGNFQCGGALIHSTIVMTAAHCYQDFFEQDIEIEDIIVYVNRTTSDFGTDYEYRRDVTEVRLHPDYVSRGTLNDVSLFLLDKPVMGVPMPILSTGPTDPETGATVTALGRGLTSEKGSIADELRFVDIDVISQEDCNDDDSYKGAVEEDIMICAGKERGGRDSCAGDSGGPLIVRGESPESDMVVGLTSWGAGCARIEKFGIYSRVSAFNDFITTGVCEMSGSLKPPSCYENMFDFGALAAGFPAATPVGSPEDIVSGSSCGKAGESCASNDECCWNRCRHGEMGLVCLGPRGANKAALKLGSGGGAGGAGAAP